MDAVSSIYLEGGEPFLFYPVVVESLRLAREMGFSTGVVTNCYWATATEDAGLWLKAIVEAGIDDLSMSDDAFHHGDESEGPAANAARAARDLGLPGTSICMEKPLDQAPTGDKGRAVVGGGVLLKGRAADKLTEGLPTRPPDDLTTCPHEELVAPERVHVDCFGNVQVCQGVSIGNLWKVPIKQLMADYDASRHPICGPLVRGGPRALASEHGIRLKDAFVDECHYCFEVRRALIDRFPDLLAPRQVYGLEDETASRSSP